MASSSRKPSHAYSDSNGKMGFGSDLKKSSKLKGKDCSSKPYIVEHRSHQKESVKAKTSREDELVKYMSNLPGYLQRLDKLKKIEENAFNVGVLDWSRLEKWKGGQRFDPANVRSSSLAMDSSNLSTKMSKKLSSPFVSSGTNSTEAKTVCSSLRFQDSVANSKSNLGGDKMVPSISKNGYEGILEKEGETGLEQRTGLRVRPQQSTPVRPRDNLKVCDNDASKRGVRKVKDLNEKVVSSTSHLPSKLRVSDVSTNLKESRKFGRGETTKQMGDLQKACIARSEDEPVNERNIVLLWPRKVSEYGSSEDQPRISLDRIQKKPVQRSNSGRFSHVKIHSKAHTSKIPYSFPLAIPHVELDKEENIAVELEQSSDEHHNPKILSASEAEKSSDMATNATGTKTLDQEKAGLAARMCRHPSPNCRLSFSLSRMARSLSSKETSSVPQLNSTYVSVKSSPVTSKTFACNDASNKEKGSVPNRARSSPLRRMLDPLLKSKGATASGFHSSKKNLSSTGSFDSFGVKPFHAIESFDSEKCDTSSVEAHLQIMMKNGLPLLRFVIDNNSNVLVATKMNVTSSVKNDSACYYTFYSIDEIKKKGGSWINQSTKEKSCEFVYNVIGQMRINSRSTDSNGQYSVKEFMVKEFELFDVEASKVDHSSTKLRSIRELAAVVIRIPLNSGS